jgi:AcrR family transcriptional regulator
VSVTRTGRAAPLPPDERRLAILQAVLPVVRTHGTDVTTRELAEAAGVAEGTLFRVFDDKESLVREAVAAALDPSDFIAALGAVDLGLPIEERLAAVIRLGTARVGDLALWMSLIHRMARDGEGPDRRRAMPHAGWRQRQETAVLLIRAELRRLLEPDSERLRYPVDTAIVLLESLLNGTVMQGADRLRQGLGPQTGDPDVVVDFFLHGALRPEPTC